MRSGVVIREVGPRDGFQNEDRFIPTDMKVEIIEELALAGLPWIEVTSFVNPERVPQLADAAEVLRALNKRNLGKVEVVAFVPNLRGLERANACGVRNATTALTVSDELNLSNFNKTTDAMLDALPELLQRAKTLEIDLEVTVGTAFGDTQGRELGIERVVEIIETVVSMGVRKVCLGDTVGVGNPRRVGDTFCRIIENHPDIQFAAHFHDTRGLAVANAFAAWREGVTVFDASYGGLGGCPFAPGSSGNLATEILVYMFEEMGVKTGINKDHVCSVSGMTKTYLDRPNSDELRMSKSRRDGGKAKGDLI